MDCVKYYIKARKRCYYANLSTPEHEFFNPDATLSRAIFDKAWCFYRLVDELLFYGFGFTSISGGESCE